MIYSAADILIWAAVLIACFVLVGAGLALIGAIGFLRLPTFYERIHAPTLSTSWGTGGIMTGSILYVSMAGHRLVAHEVLIGVFITMSTPVTFMLLSRAALHRDRFENILMYRVGKLTRSYSFVQVIRRYRREVPRSRSDPVDALEEAASFGAVHTERALL